MYAYKHINLYFFIYIFNLDVSEMGHSVVKFHRITVNQNYMSR